MNSINLIYENGHFYNTANNKRVLFKEGKEFCIVSDKNDFIAAPQAGRLPKVILSSDELLNKIKTTPAIIDFHKICERNDVLFFYIHIDRSYSFRVVLSEDLYLVKTGNVRSEYKLFDCQAQTVENTENYIRFFEPVYGKSLSDLRKCTYVHYFGNKGNPSANAITDFTLSDRKTTIDDLRSMYISG